MAVQQWTYNPTVAFTKSGGTFYVQQQQQASSCSHKFITSATLSNKEYPTTCRVCCIFKQSERHPMPPLQRVFGHVMRDCPSKRVLVIRDDGEYSSASDFDEDTLALLADDHEGNDDHPEEHIGTGDADHYESLIVQRVLSTQMERVE
jgi:hypothetical protein